MAVRYSGDVEARAQHLGRGLYHVVVRWSAGRGRVARLAFRIEGPARTSPEGYDKVVRTAIREADRSGRLPLERGMLGRVILRRVFQAACPR